MFGTTSGFREQKGRAISSFPVLSLASPRLSLRVAGAALLLALSVPAAAQEADTVTIGGQAKRTGGTVTGVEAGDAACYLTLKDARGARFQEMADFSICEKGARLKGKRVTLTYQLGKVMADSCQGNMDCKQTRTVALVMDAKVVPAPK